MQRQKLIFLRNHRLGIYNGDDELPIAAIGNYTGPGIGQKTIDFSRLNYLRNIDVKRFFLKKF